MPLKDNDLFGERDKVAIALERLKAFEPEEGYWVADSGGKDSTVIYDLCHRSGCRCEYHHNLTTVDPPEVIHFLRKHHPDTVIDQPEMPLLRCLATVKFFPPTSSQRWCCERYKERGGKERFLVDGVRAAESPRRRQRGMVDSCMRGGLRKFLHVIIDWTDDEVWEYIRSRGLPYCGLYNEGMKRVGCVMCPKATQSNRIWEMQRWPRIAKAWERNIVKAYENRPATKPELTKFSSGQELWEWWRDGAKTGENPDQEGLFE